MVSCLAEPRCLRLTAQSVVGLRGLSIFHGNRCVVRVRLWICGYIYRVVRRRRRGSWSGGVSLRPVRARQDVGGRNGNNDDLQQENATRKPH